MGFLGSFLNQLILISLYSDLLCKSIVDLFIVIGFMLCMDVGEDGFFNDIKV